MEYTPPSGKNAMKHVERADLYINLRKRVEYLHAFLNFTQDDIDNLNKGAKFLRAAIPSLAHRLYEKLLQFDLTARALKLRSTNTHSDDDDLFTIDSPQVQRRKIFWKWYLTRLLADPSRMDYWEYLDKIGRMHRGRILIHPLHIEYLHMNVCLGHVQDLFFEYISTTDEFPVVFRFALIRTLNKLLNVQNDLITRWYVKDGEEFYHDDEAANDSTFVEGATECPFDASHISEGADSKDSSMRSGSTYTDPDRERKSGSSSDRMQRQDKSASSNHRTSRKSSRLDLKDVTPSALDGSPTQTNLEIPLHPAQATAKETPEPRSPTTQTKPSRDQNATPRGPIMGPPTGIPYSGLPGTNAATFETKIWSASDAKQKKSPRLPRF